MSALPAIRQNPLSAMAGARSDRSGMNTFTADFVKRVSPSPAAPASSPVSSPAATTPDDTLLRRRMGRGAGMLAPQSIGTTKLLGG